MQFLWALPLATLPAVEAFATKAQIGVDPGPDPNTLRACKDLGPQAPRDLSTTGGALNPGANVPTAAVLNEIQAMAMYQTNVHFHLGAEHKSDFFNDGSLSAAYDDGEGSTDERPGWMCATDSLSPAQLDDSYEWQYCKGDMHVGMSYEVHYVHSSAGKAEQYQEDGLASAAGGGKIANPMIVVEAMVFQIVAGEDVGDQDLVHGWEHTPHDDALAYSGSTTGTGNDNNHCSPYVVSWHVDPYCHQVTAATFDNMCKQMKEQYGMQKDLHPHGSRILVSPDWVVPAEHVRKLSDLGSLYS